MRIARTGNHEEYAMRHLLAMGDLKPAEIERIFSIAVDLKAKYEQGIREPLLPGRVWPSFSRNRRSAPA